MKMNITSWWGALIWGSPAYVFDGTPSYNYEVDKWAGTPNEEFPSVWPRFDGTYSNPAMLTASIEGLPLGDLNWFPEAKAKWMAEKDQIEAHILALNEEKYTITVGIEDLANTASISVYPNPAKDMLYVASDMDLRSARVFDVTGKLVREFTLDGGLNRTLNIADLNNGIYFVEVETANGASSTSKIIKN
jgi:hypothetical protein